MVRTNCIDSLDRTNFAQEMIGYQTCLLQLQKLGLSDTAIILSLQSDLFKEIVDMYNEMGDTISMQYGGSIAHHSQLNEKKGIFKAVPEWVTGIKRHLANNFSDPYRQSVINLFLGIY